MSSILPYKGKAMEFTLKVERTHVVDHRDRHTVTLTSNQASVHARARSAPGSPSTVKSTAEGLYIQELWHHVNSRFLIAQFKAGKCLCECWRTDVHVWSQLCLTPRSQHLVTGMNGISTEGVEHPACFACLRRSSDAASGSECLDDSDVTPTWCHLVLILVQQTSDTFVTLAWQHFDAPSSISALGHRGLDLCNDHTTKILSLWKMQCVFWTRNWKVSGRRVHKIAVTMDLLDIFLPPRLKFIIPLQLSRPFKEFRLWLISVTNPDPADFVPLTPKVSPQTWKIHTNVA